jgi:hypothetical protein
MKRKRYIFSVLICFLMVTPSYAADSDVQERIRSLEQQLDALRQLKTSQEKAVFSRETQCYQAIPSRAFCACLSSRLPGDITFEEYIRGVIGGSQRARELTAARDACGGQLSP